MNKNILYVCLFSTLFLACKPKKEKQTQPFAAFTSGSLRNDKDITEGEYQITKVSDGDTFWCVNRESKKIKVRLIGMDAPEPRNYFHKKEQPYGKEASKYAEQLLMGQTVRLEFDVNPLDQYGRTLAYAYLTDGTFVNEKIMKDGYAVLMTIPPNVKYEQRLVEAQKYARNRLLGLWKHRL